MATNLSFDLLAAAAHLLHFQLKSQSHAHVTGTLTTINFASFSHLLTQDLHPLFLKKKWTKDDRKCICVWLAKNMVDPSKSLFLGVVLRPILPHLACLLVEDLTLQDIHPKLRILFVASAFSKLLPHFPQLAPFVIQYFKKSPSLFHLLEANDTQVIMDTQKFNMTLLECAYRLLRFSPSEFSKIWNWSMIFQFVDNPDPIIFSMAYSCIGILFSLSDKKLRDSALLKRSRVDHRTIMLQLEENWACEYNEAQSLYSSLASSQILNLPQIKTAHFSKTDLHPSVTEVCGLLLPVQDASVQRNLSTRRFVDTKITRKNMTALALAVCKGKPILLEGITGSGKTALIEELSYLTGNPKLLKIHLGDQSDAKVLLGTYICTDVPGEFKWVKGILTRAVVEGLWIVIEDINLAPVEILSILLPLLEKRELFIPGRGELIKAHTSFQLFATQTITTGRQSHDNSLLANFWTRVVVEPLSCEELTTVLQSKYPNLAPLIPKVVQTFEILQSTKPTPSQTESNVSNVPYIHSRRAISVRDVIKWCERCQNIFQSVKLNPDFISSQVKEYVLMEAMDCFCGGLPKLSIRQQVAHKIAQCWGVALDRVNYFLDSHKPEILSSKTVLNVGRVPLPINNATQIEFEAQSTFAYSRASASLMEKIGKCIQSKEPVLLVGETGCGKTTTIQHLTHLLKQKLVVLNLNQQSDSSDLFGGFKPVDLQTLLTPIKKKFDSLFAKTFSKKNNSEFLAKVHQFFISKKWTKLISIFKKTLQKVEALQAKEVNSSKRKKSVMNTGDEWTAFRAEVSKFEVQHDQIKNNFAFAFVEGALVKAIQEGHWVLLDEINLASAETLESLSGLLEGGSLTLTERGDIEPIKRHPNFCIFACMNPPNDIGKRELPPGLRNRFTEFFVDELENPEDLTIFVSSYLKNTTSNVPINDVVSFYLEARNQAIQVLSDGSHQRPRYSLRTLARTLEYCRATLPFYGFHRALFEGASMSFLTQLDTASIPIMENLIAKYLKKGISPKIFQQLPNCPGPNFTQFEDFWLEKGPEQIIEDKHYIRTASIRKQLINLGRVILSGKYPVLLQGPTSAGKTSMVAYLARMTGHRFVRINNHEHTDLQEYLGQYVADSSGKLSFHEGILVEAVRKGYWVVLDELNLAPSEVLEALNRLLDDNRELQVLETQEVIKPHPHFMLFATQNPPGLYGGRKVLSRAFRNRFVELHFDEIPDTELEEILHKRCSIPPKWATSLVLIMKDLQRHRQGSRVFAGKQGFITLRDLFRWADRHPETPQQLAEEGYMLLAERLRNDEEKELVKSVLEKHLKVVLNMEKFYDDQVTRDIPRITKLVGSSLMKKIVWTKSMKRLYCVIGRCLRHSEPFLLVGETGTGKTTICQLYSEIFNQGFHILNCHQHTETADFLGSLRPVRGKEYLKESMIKKIATLIELLQDIEIPFSAADKSSLSNIGELNKLTANLKQTLHSPIPTTKAEKIVKYLSILEELNVDHGNYVSLFKWNDGPLVESMKYGHFFLVDEISLAEDAVLERLNSVLEPNRLLVLAEKGGLEVEELIAHSDFRIMATMNPGGDFGKKELSPALRNRFTEIWVPQFDNEQELKDIIEKHLEHDGLQGTSSMILSFLRWFSDKLAMKSQVLSLRDILSWVDFINLTYPKLGQYGSLLHGAFLVLIDSLGMIASLTATELRKQCIAYLLNLIPEEERETIGKTFTTISQNPYINDATQFGIEPFLIKKGTHQKSPFSLSQYTLESPTTSNNIQRLLRALQTKKPILMEGPPGVGKTSLVAALSAVSGHRVVRINLSEQTDMMDLLGADLPNENENGDDISAQPSFSWRDGVFLSALKAGDWVLLDEMNLASQSVLEGLNAVLDHRATVYIPELNQEFKCPPTFRVFACQNPTQQGGGRKGLPKSFLNRWTKVYVEKFDTSDLLFITNSLYPSIPQHNLSKMITFNQQLFKEVMVDMKYGLQGTPWELNLRDVLRWCDLIMSDGDPAHQNVGKYVDMLYLQRFRTTEDRLQVMNLFEKVFQEKLTVELHPYWSITPTTFQVGHSVLSRKSGSKLVSEDLVFLQSFLNPLENLMKVVSMGWMSLIAGSTGSGKTALLKILADMTGNVLHTFHISSSIDTTELLGGFEQFDLNRHKKEILKTIEDLVSSVSEDDILNSESKDSHKEAKLIQNLWYSFQKQSQNRTDLNHAFEHSEYELLIQVLNQLKLTTKSNKVDELLSKIGKLQKVIHSNLSGHFEWIDGLLVNAMRNGDWIFIDNANLCPGSVLDRLNPLLEPHGTLILSERGLVNGVIQEVKPHPEFRVFLALDPKNGEVSRAMRNRGIEIAIQPLPIDSHDTVELLEKAGIKDTRLAKLLISFHIEILKRSSETLTIRDIIYCAQLIVEQNQRGKTLFSILKLSLQQAYRKCGTDITREVRKHVFNKQVVSEIERKNETMGVVPYFPKDSILTRFFRQLKYFHKCVLENWNNPVIPYITKNLLQMSSVDDWKFRQFWLEHAYEHSNLNQQSGLITQLKEVFSIVWSHPLVVERTKMAFNIFQKTHLKIDLNYEPVDLRFNEPLMYYLKEKSPLISSELPTLKLLFKRLDLYYYLVFQKCYEKNVISKIQSKNSYSYTVLEKSYLFHNKQLTVQSLNSGILCLFYKFFVILDESIEEWIVSDIQKDQIIAIKNLIRVRSNFWRFFEDKTEFSPIEFGLYWNWMTKHIKVVKDKKLAFSKTLETLLEKFNEEIHKEIGIPTKNTLWTKGGHPYIVQAPQIQETLQRFSALLETENLSTASKKSIVEAISTLYSINLQRTSQTANLPLLQSLSELSLNFVAQKIENVPAWTKKLSSYCDHHSHLTEFNALCGVVDGLFSLSAEKKDPIWLKRVIDFGLEHSSRSAFHFVFYKILLWTIEDTSTAPKASFLKQLYVELLFVIHSMSWNGSFNERPPKQDKSQRSRQEDHRDAFMARYTGVQIFHGVKTKLTMNMLSEQSSISIFKHEEYLETLKNLSLHLQSPLPLHTVEENDWILIASQFYHTLTAFENYFPEGEWNRISTYVKELFSHFLNRKGGSFSSSVNIDAVRNALLKCNDIKFAQIVKELIFPCLKLFSESDVKEPQNSIIRGKLWVYLGMLRLFLYMPTQPIDPTQKFLLQSDQYQKFIDNITYEVTALLEQEYFFTGRKTNFSVEILDKDKQMLLKKQSDIQSKVVQRPSAKFPEFFNALTQFSKTMISKERILQLFNEIESLDRHTLKFKSLLAQESLWQDNVGRFTLKMLGDYPDYQDITKCISTSLYQIKSGIRIFLNSKISSLPIRVFTSAIPSNPYLDHSRYDAISRVQRSITYILQLPSISETVPEMIDYILDDSTLNAIEALIESNKAQLGTPPADLKKIFTLLLKSTLCRMYGFVIYKGHLTKSAHSLLDKLFSVYVRIWKKKSEEEKQKEEEKQQLFKYKIQEHKIETEEERDERKFKEMFPDFEGVWQDLVDVDEDFEPVQENEEPEEEIKKDDKDVKELKDNVQFESLLPAEIYQLCQVHKLIYQNFGSNWKKSKLPTVSTNDLFETFEKCYQLSSTLLSGILHETNSMLDVNIQTANILMSQHLAKTITLVKNAVLPERKDSEMKPEKKSEIVEALKEEDKQDRVKVKEELNQETEQSIHDKLIENFYSRVDFVESSLTRKPLEQLKSRLSELLEEFQGNAVLIQLLAIVNRILEFPINSPLMKILTGIEFLLTKAESWENSCAKRYSIDEHLSVLLSIVSRWRRQELNYWPVILRTKEQDFESKAREWFFRFYLLLFTGESRSDITDMRGTFEEYIESSNLGEFRERVEMLKLFYLQMKVEAQMNIDRGYRNESGRVFIMNLLGNLHGYYGQFLTKWESNLESMRDPIEKELKDKIKLGKWEDRTYYRLKDTTEKSHRHIARMTRKYEVILNQPISEILSKPLEGTSEKFVYPTVTNKSFETDTNFNFVQLSTLDPQLTQQFGYEESKTNKLSKITVRAHGMASKNIIPTLATHEESMFMSNLCESIISTVKELQKNLDPKAKPIKKRNLVLLLQQLQKMGLSFHEEKINPEQTDSLYLMTLDVLENFSLDDNALNMALSKILMSSDKYYFKLIATLRKLRHTRLKVHKDLSRLEILKTLNFSEFMLSMCISARKSLCALNQDMNDLELSVVNLDNFTSIEEGESFSFPPQTKSKQLLQNLKKCIDNTHCAISDNELLLNLSNTPSKQKFNEIRGLCNKIKTDLDKTMLVGNGNNIAMNVEHYLINNSIDKIFQSSFKMFNKLNKLNKDPSKYQFQYQFNQSLQSTFNEINKIKSNYVISQNLNLEHSDKVFLKSFKTDLEVLIEFIQISIQSVYKNSTKIINMRKREDSDEEVKEDQETPKTENEQETPQKQENQIYNIVETQEWYLKSFELFNIPRFIQLFNHLKIGISRYSEKNPSNRIFPLCLGVLRNLKPLIIQYQKLMHLHVFAFSRFHREMSKLSHIMMSTFLTLYNEGYCSQDPEESKQEGETLTTDKEQAGMGAGTGIKDVSKEMDNEEQVLGEKYNEDEDEPLKDDQKLKQEEGLEMETEFEGKYHDVEQEAKEPDEKDQEEEEEEEEELDKEMGKVDKENNDVVDEKLWDEEDEEGEQKEQENIEENSDMPESDKPTKQEMVANEEEGTSDKKGAPKEKDDGASEEEEKEQSDEDLPEEDPEQQDYVDNMFDDPKTNKQPHGEDEEFELPDMDLDKDEANEGEQQMPEELDIGEKSEEEEQQVDENNDEMGEEKEEEFPEVESPENEEEPKTDEEENDENNREGEVIPDTIEEEKEEPEEDNNYTSNRNENEQQTFGVQDNKGKPTNDIKLTASNESNPDDAAQNNDDDESKSANNEKQKEDTKGSKQEGESLDPEKKENKKTPEAPNPFRSLGDALKHWKNKLNVEDPKNPENNETKEDKESKEKEKTEDAPTKDNDQNMFEYIQEGEDKKEDNQVLGIASEEQLEKFDTEKIGQYDEEMEDQEEEESQLDVEEDNAQDDNDDEKQNKSKANEKSKLGTFKEKPLKEEIDDESLEEDIQNPEEQVDQSLLKSPLDNQKEIVGPARAFESSVFATESNSMGMEELIVMRNDLTKFMADWYKDEDRVNKGIQIWRYLQRLTGPLSQELCEQLRLILEPTQTSKLKGDYRTGKRLNMRKVIPYIASNFRKDKIWLRRTKPAKREYQILIGIDDSESIAIGGAGELLREAVATITQALVHLDVGQISIVKFGSEFELLHSFTEPFSDQIAAQVFPRLQFKQQKTNMALFLETSVQMLENARNEFNSDGNLLQIMFVMSDGRFGNERKTLQRWLRRSEEQNILVVFLIMDIAKEKESILDIQSLGYLEDGKMTVTPYIDGFPFLYYIILQRISNLPQVLADALRQWFEMISNKE